jgi:octaprenyl-diphosphate synthase
MTSNEPDTFWGGFVAAERSDPGSPLSELIPTLARDIEGIEERLKGALPASYPFLAEAAAYATDSGGKRVRPLLMSAGFRALGQEETRPIHALAAAFQLIHTATLVHDDVIDRAELRRGKPSVPRAFGVSAAIVAGDYLFVRAFQLAAPYGPEIIHRCGEACAELAQGEMMQENSRLDLTIGRERYVRIMMLKTASIVSAGLASVAMVAGAPSRVVERLAEYGTAVGVAFQIRDDLLDVYGDPDETGKPRQSDWREGLPTLLSLDAHAALEGRERAEFERLFMLHKKRGADLMRLQELTDRTDARQRSIEEGERCVERALGALDAVPPGPYRALLERVARGVTTRRF